MSLGQSLRAISSVAMKELLHVWRDRRVLLLILILPPLLTIIFGHAFEVLRLTNAPTVLQDRDQSDESASFTESLSADKTFALKVQKGSDLADPDLLRNRVAGAIVLPPGWGKSLRDGNPMPLRLILDGSDTTTAGQLEGAVRMALGEFQLAARNHMIENLPEEVIDMGQKLPVEVRKQFVSAMEPWTTEKEVLFNPQLKFINYVTPGIIGLILQLLTVTLMACTITRERESGTLSQLVITSLRREEIVIGKVLPYLGISLFLIASSVAVAHFYFSVPFQQPLVLTLICVLFLVCSLGLGLLISAFCDSQAQAIQFAVFFLLPVFPLSGAFAPLEQLPPAVALLSQAFPLTHFCQAFRLINMHGADFSFIIGNLVFLAVGSLVTCGGAALLLSREQA